MRFHYLDVETYTLTSSYFESRYLDVKTLIISSYHDALMRLFIWGGVIHSRQHSRQLAITILLRLSLVITLAGVH